MNSFTVQEMIDDVGIPVGAICTEEVFILPWEGIWGAWLYGQKSQEMPYENGGFPMTACMWAEVRGNYKVSGATEKMITKFSIDMEKINGS